MDQAVELLQSLARNSDSNTVTNYLNFCSDSKIFCTNKEKREGNVNFVNSLLNSRGNYTVGLSILEVLIDQLPKDVLCVNILSWIQLTIKGLVNQENDSICPLAWKVLGKLLRCSTDFPEARKHIALNFIPKILDHFVKEAKNSRESISTILQCLEETLRAYGKSCGFHKEVLGELIFSNLDAPESVVFVAGQCFLNLAASGSPGVNADNYVASWMKQQKFLINCLHGQLDSLFENISEVQENVRVYSLEEKYPSIQKISEKSLIRKKQQLAKQFQSLSLIFKVMLLGKFPVRKRILPEAILSLVWRGLAINRHTLSKQHSIDTVNLATVISKINESCLEILDALLCSCKLNLLPFSSMICRIIYQTFKWTEIKDWPFGVTRPHSSLRIKIYECLYNWLTVSRACSGIEKHLDDIFNSIILDIHQEPPIVALKVPGGKGKKMKTVQPEEANPLTDFILNPQMNAECCEAALKCIAVLLTTSSTLMKPAYHRNLQEIVISKIIAIQQSTVPPPYLNGKCRFALYDVLLSLCENPHGSFPPPINYAPELFSAGVKDSSVEISRHCSMALRSIDKILRPVCPSLDLPLSENTLPMLEVSAHDMELAGYLLNDDSARKRKMKRKRDHQLTSTPLSNSQAKHSFIDDVDHVTFNDSLMRVDNEAEEGNSESSKANGARLNINGMCDDKYEATTEINGISGKKNEAIEGIRVSSDTNENDKVSSKPVQEVPMLEVSARRKVSEGYLSKGGSAQLTSTPEHQEIETSKHNEEESPGPLSGPSDPNTTVREDTVKSSETTDVLEEIDITDNASDSEMINSFVDEVI